MPIKSNKTIISSKNVQVQTITQPREYKSLAIMSRLSLQDRYWFWSIPFWFTTIALLILSLSTVIFSIINSRLAAESDAIISTQMTEANFLYGIYVVIGIFLLIGVLYLPHQALQLPCPIFWNIIYSLTILYMMFLFFLLMQDKTTIRQILNYICPDIAAEPLKQRIYASDCRVYTPQSQLSSFSNIYTNADFYIACHFFGWYIKMIVLRDIKFCWILGTIFELLEMYFTPWLPNFNECWWDRYIFDLFGANALGIFCGYIQIKIFDLKEFKWTAEQEDNDDQRTPTESSNSERDIESLGQHVIVQLRQDKKKYLNSIKLKEIVVSYFTQLLDWKKWRMNRWKIFQRFNYFAGSIFMSFFISIVNLNNFFGKELLWIKADHMILFWRVLLWGIAAMSATIEFFDYMTNPKIKKVGDQMFVLTLCMSAELGIIFKLYSGQFQNKDLNIAATTLWILLFIFLGYIGMYLGVKQFFLKRRLIHEKRFK